MYSRAVKCRGRLGDALHAERARTAGASSHRSAACLGGPWWSLRWAASPAPPIRLPKDLWWRCPRLSRAVVVASRFVDAMLLDGSRPHVVIPELASGMRAAGWGALVDLPRRGHQCPQLPRVGRRGDGAPGSLCGGDRAKSAARTCCQDVAHHDAKAAGLLTFSETMSGDPDLAGCRCGAGQWAALSSAAPHLPVDPRHCHPSRSR